MKKFVKITGIVLASIIVLLIVLPFAFKGKIVSTIKEEANKNLNAKLEFEDVRLSLIRNFPNFSIRLDELSLAGVDTFESDTLIRFRRFEAGLNLMSVISGEQIEINKVILSGAKINAIVLEDGTANWDIMITDSTESEPEVAEEEPAEDTAPMVLQLKKIAVEHSDIIYNDKESDVFAELSDFNFELKGDLTDDITNLNIKTWIQKITVSSEGVRYLSSAKAEFEGEINADLEQSIYTFKENKFKLNAIALAFDGTVEMPDTNIVTDVTFAVSDTKFRSILSMIPAIYKKDLEGVETSGTFNMTGYAKGTYNGMNMPAYGVNLLIKDGRFNYPDLPESIENIQVDLAVKAEEGSGDDMTIDINKAHIETAGNPFDAQIHIAMTAADTYLKGELNGKIDFGTLESLVPLEETKIKGILKTDLSFEGKLSDIDNERYDQFKADGILDLQNFELTGADYPPTQISKMLLRFSPQYAALETFNARSGKSDFIMDGRIDNILNYVFEDELLTGRLNFKSALIDADELMASESSELPDDNGDSNEVPADEMSEGDEVIRIPENIKFVLNADIKKLIYDGMAIENIQGLISLDAGKASMKNLSMDMLGGTTKMSGSYNSKPEKPLADFNLDLSNVDIKALYENFMSIQEMAPIAKYCSGNISAKLSLNTALDNEMMPDYPTLNSAGNLSSRAIGITNNKLFEALGNKTKISMLSNPTLKDVNLSFEIKNGNLEVKPTEFNIKDIEMSLAGTQNINTAIDFDLGMNLPKKYASKFLSKIPLKNMPEHVELAVGIGGTNDKPKITSVNSNITGGIKEEITEKVEEVKEDLKEEAQKIINEAQKKADAIIAAAEQQAEALDANAKKAGDKLVSEAERQGQKLVDEARNPITKAAAKKAKAKMIKEAQKKSGQLQNEAKSKGDKIINTAENKADKIMEEARRKADSL